jgi:TonB-linked SusC/RagA family outer membrane protein
MKNNASPHMDTARIYHSLRIFSILISIFLFAGIVSAKPAVPYSQQTRISLTVKNKDIKDVFREIEKKSQFIFIFNDNVIDSKKKVSISVKNETVDTILKKLLEGTDISYKFSDRQIIVFNSKSEKKENGRVDNPAPTSVNGIVTDEANQPLAGVTVIVKGTGTGTVSDINGQFSLKVPQSDATLTFSFIGYKPQTSKASKETLKIVLAEDAQLMDEVVVIGYGVQKKSDLTGAISSLKERDFNKGVVTSPTDLIQGRIPGVNITTNGGEPGAGVSVRIRGANSIRSGQEPLYVVDGIPLDITDVQPSGASTAGVGSSSAKNPLNFLNPDDIESIDALKDASATAIYGSRGANGVVIVTTKKGKEGKSKVSYSGYAGVSELPSKYPVLNASQYNAARVTLGLAAADLGSNTDWQDQIFRTAYSQNHSLSLSGGNKSSNYRASLNYMNQDGIILKTGLKKYSGRLNVSAKALNDRLTIDAGLTAARTNDQRAPLGESGGIEGDLLLSALKLNPTYPVYNANGTYYQVSDQVRNPLAMINLTNDNTQTDRILGNLTATLNITKGLNYKVNMSVDQTKATRKVTQDAQLSYVTDKGTATINNVELGNALIENYLTYDFKLSDAHKFSVLAGQSYQKFRIYSYGMTETGFAKSEIDNLNELALGKSTQVVVSSDITINELQSFFGRLNYNLLDRYLFTVNFRADGSTKFGKNNKYGYFPSAAVAWRMSEENFIKQLDMFSNLKMRLGAGITGNQEIMSKISQESLGTVTGAVLNGGSTITPGYTLVRTPNPDIKWEKTTQYNWGIDFGVLKGRLSGTVDLFYKNTTDVQMYTAAAMPTPSAMVWTNKGLNIINKGIEIALNAVIIDTKDINWSANINFSKIDNKVKNMDISKIPTGYPSGPGITGTPSQYIVNNESLGTFWGKTFLGFDSAGKSIFAKDANGVDIEGVIGNALPNFTYNFGTNVTWKQFDLGLNFNGVQGNDVYNNLANIIDQMTMFGSGWNTTATAVASGEATSNVLNYSSRFIEDGSYLRLSNATLGYTFKLAKQKYINRLRLYVSGTNLLTFTNYTGYDPEVNATRYTNGVPAMGIGWTSYPKARTFTVGVNLEL